MSLKRAQRAIRAQIIVPPRLAKLLADRILPQTN